MNQLEEHCREVGSPRTSYEIIINTQYSEKYYQKVICLVCKSPTAYLSTSVALTFALTPACACKTVPTNVFPPHTSGSSTILCSKVYSDGAMSLQSFWIEDENRNRKLVRIKSSPPVKKQITTPLQFRVECIESH